MSQMVAGGIIKEISYNDPIVGAGFFEGIEGETGTYVLGGMINAADPRITGGRQLVVEKQLVPGSIDMTVVNDMSEDTPALERAWALSQFGKDTVWTFANTNGEVYKGVGVVVDLPSADGNKSSFSLKVASGAGFVKM